MQLKTSNEASKAGIQSAQALELCQTIATLPNLQLRGLMALPTAEANPTQLREEFLMCQQLFIQLQQLGIAVDTLSMGMSADLELAIECGSTCVRVGTALFGPRPVKSNPSH